MIQPSDAPIRTSRLLLTLARPIMKINPMIGLWHCKVVAPSRRQEFRTRNRRHRPVDLGEVLTLRGLFRESADSPGSDLASRNRGRGLAGHPAPYVPVRP
jgi:hypothetical protein